MTSFQFNETDYKKRINKTKKLPLVVIIAMIIILCIIVIFVRPQSQNIDQFYFVKIDSFSTYKEASKLATDIQQMSGAGYVYYDEQYHVFASFYHSLDDAKKVLDNICQEYTNSKVHTLEVERFSPVDHLSKKQNDAVDALTKSILNTIYELSQFSIAFDNKSKAFNELSIKIQNMNSSFNSLYKNFNMVFHSESKYNTAKSNLLEISKSLERLCESCERTFSQTIKFETIDIIICYSSFVDCF